MKKPQEKIFEFLKKIKTKHPNLELNCFMKFKNMTIFEKTMRRISKGKDELECDEYKITLDEIKYIIEKLDEQKKKKIKKKKIKKKEKKEKKEKTPEPKKPEPKKPEPKKPEPKKQKTHRVQELKKICKEKGIKGYSKLKKVELLKKCLNEEKPKTPEPKIQKTKPKIQKPLTKEECGKWEQNKKNIINKKIINIKTNKPINYLKKNGELTKKAKEIDDECTKFISKSNSSVAKKPQKPIVSEAYDQDNAYMQILSMATKNNLEEILDEVIEKYQLKGDQDIEEELNIYEKMLIVSASQIAFNDKLIQNFFKKPEPKKQKTPEPKKQKTPELKNNSEDDDAKMSELPEDEEPKTQKTPEPKFKQNQIEILEKIKNNQLKKNDMNDILKKINLKTQIEYLKELILIGLNKL
jgi:ABC-type antimicrobial peptide transport system permease subunit